MWKRRTTRLIIFSRSRLIKIFNIFICFCENKSFGLFDYRDPWNLIAWLRPKQDLFSSLSDYGERKMSQHTSVINFEWAKPISISLTVGLMAGSVFSFGISTTCWAATRSSEEKEKSETFTGINKKRIKNVSKRLNIKEKWVFLSDDIRLINQADSVDIVWWKLYLNPVENSHNRALCEISRTWSVNLSSLNLLLTISQGANNH